MSKTQVTFIQACLFVSLLMASSLSLAVGPVPKLVSNLDLNLYSGRWYEVASSHRTYQKDCTCVTADYTVLDDSSLKVDINCRQSTPQGFLKTVEALAQTTGTVGRLRLRLNDQEILPYWVVFLADDYRYAVVSNGLRDSITILSRSPELASEDRKVIMRHLRDDGFNRLLVKPTQQQACSYEP
ncbi:MAG: lipocalin family protein [Proteobacteria bacterium]|nr:lipocalin family protein [Pseudomonadota bacterium]